MKSRDPRPILEDKVQQAIVELLNLKAHRDLIYYHVPNQGERSAATTRWLMKMGMLLGAPDLCFTLPDGHSAFLEVKTGRGRLSVEQLVFADRCKAVGAPYVVARSVDEAEAALRSWGCLREKRAA